MVEAPKLNLLGWGPCDSQILWIDGKLLKVKFIHMTESRSEVFHYSEILNYKEIFITKELKIVPYDITK